jgi:hypothetical protein
MAHAYSKLYGLPATGLRFFTVYGPWGRPDMAMFIFTKAILEGRPIQLFNYGRMRRDFTYVDDIVEAMERLLDRPPAGDPNWSGDAPDPSSSSVPWRLYNIGNNRSVEVAKVVDLLERELGRKAVKELVEMQPGDVPETCADIDDLTRSRRASRALCPGTAISIVRFETREFELGPPPLMKGLCSARHQFVGIFRFRPPGFSGSIRSIGHPQAASLPPAPRAR